MQNKELINIVHELKSKKIINRDAEIVASTGVNKGVLSTYLSGKEKASGPFIAKFEEVYKVKLFPNISHLGDQSGALMEIILINKSLSESIRLASEAQKISAQSQLIDAESRKKLLENNRDLTLVIKNILETTAGSFPGIQPIVPSIPVAVLELLAELSVPKLYKSKEEALAQLGIKFHQAEMKKTKTGNEADASK